MNPLREREYSYLDAGFDGFLSRSVDNLSRVNLDSQGPQSRAIRFDAAQTTGAMGDTMRVGKININGAAGNITANDGNNDFFILGDE